MIVRGEPSSPLLSSSLSDHFYEKQLEGFVNDILSSDNGDEGKDNCTAEIVSEESGKRQEGEEKSCGVEGNFHGNEHFPVNKTSVSNCASFSSKSSTKSCGKNISATQPVNFKNNACSKSVSTSIFSSVITCSDHSSNFKSLLTAPNISSHNNLNLLTDLSNPSTVVRSNFSNLISRFATLYTSSRNSISSHRLENDSELIVENSSSCSCLAHQLRNFHQQIASDIFDSPSASIQSKLPPCAHSTPITTKFISLITDMDQDWNQYCGCAMVSYFVFFNSSKTISVLISVM
ncbi:unnamed protein product [Thelazia callipaeda]|uniref:Uncharacterized protein n=1 Tax=Thelazia callipaeda TaxID=103827 RepID=A0A0N5D536_THECL|nr:unnamed protein product [Thelazia callipaeda]